MYDENYMTYELEIAQLQEEFKNKNYGCWITVCIGNNEDAIYLFGDSPTETPLVPIKIVYNPLQESLTTDFSMNSYIISNLSDLREAVEFILTHSDIYFEYPEVF